MVQRPSTIAEPTFYLDAQGNEDPQSRYSNSTAFSTIEILPAELPLPSSEHFSNKLFPYIESLFAEHKTTEQQELQVALRRSMIVKNGHLVEPHAWLQSVLDASENYASLHKPDTDVKKVLVLGSGLVAATLLNLSPS